VILGTTLEKLETRRNGGSGGMKFPEITERIIVAALKVHSAIGPGVLESVYKTCLAHELKQTGLTSVERGTSSGRV